jgi:hypothetical protein
VRSLTVLVLIRIAYMNFLHPCYYRLATISPFLTYVYLVRTPLIRLLLKAMYLYYINIVGRDILPIATYLLKYTRKKKDKGLVGIVASL